MSASAPPASAPALPPRARGFLRRVNLAAAWGEGLDGYDLGSISVALPAITIALQLDPVLAGLIGASSLIGIFIGAPLAGFLTDRFGRRLLFTIDIIAFIVLGLAQAVAQDAWQLLIARVLLGIAIGAEYSIGAAMLSEFAPARGRGRRLSALLVSWFGGYLIAVIASYVIIDVAGLSWRWVLAASVVPALVTAVLRFGFPESPRWLLGRGREQDARAVIEKHLGGRDYYDAERFGDEDSRGRERAKLFDREHRARLLFLCVFWIANVTPYFAILTFAPTVLRALNIGGGAAGTAIGTIVINVFAAVGALVGMFTIERMGRRRQAVLPFWIMAVALGLIGLWMGAPPLLIVALFAAFSFVNAVQGNLTAVYPIEILPTEVRSSGVGVAAAASRIGAALGTFLLPVGIESIGIGPCMLIAAAVCIVGGVLSQFLAPETTGQDLRTTSTGQLGVQRVAQGAG